jgi:ABC-type Fe3+/spermidine/putrescine transport system ATPase subunit
MAATVLDHVSKMYGAGVLAVDDLELEIAEGELWLGDEFANDVPAEKRNIAMVFQHGALYPAGRPHSSVPMARTGRL